MAFQHKKDISTDIPTASMPDIIFTLTLFFMATTVMRQYSGLPVVLPKAKQIEKLQSKIHVTELWVSKEELISIDGKLVEIENIRNIIYNKRVKDPQLIVSIRADERVTMELISKIHKELRLADALKVNYSTKTAV
ncbi:MAG TPA: biopolymer transporter ExbD [Candidatus Marinimicrobia bacterium]|nr:biopolymer transporter ExbD [Candidatus Neomarinimicrobiota bacterium]HRU92390.1 biopolymer transporter ExbD [Candidatus Neomarinimicrobiota bacterium]